MSAQPLSPDAAAVMRRFFRTFNRFMLLLWDLGLGGWLNRFPRLLGSYMVLIHTGRKTGRQRRSPVNYAVVGDVVYCTAGFGAGSDWYRNLLANPAVEIWLPNGWWAGNAEDVTGGEDAVFVMRQVLIASAFAARAAGIDPLTMSDEDLRAATREYRLVRITRTAARTGGGGPGRWADVWSALSFVLALLLLTRRTPAAKSRPRR